MFRSSSKTARPSMSKPSSAATAPISPATSSRCCRRFSATASALSKRIQKRRLAAGQLVLELPEVELILDEEGKVIDAVPEDQSFTHTLIEMFMVEANEAVARLLDSIDVPFLRRTHPEPPVEDS